MLRNVILGIAVVLFACGVVAFALRPDTVGLLLFSGILLLGTAAERIGYGRAAAGPPVGQSWARTAERFVDPESGRLVSVWFDAGTGERRYVDDGEAPHRD